MNRKKLTPQEKKLLSYVKDMRNVYGEAGARSRFSIARRKSFHHQALRHERKLILQKAIKAAGEELEIVESKVQSVAPKRWRKCADAPLGELISDKLNEGYKTRASDDESKRARILKSAKKRWKPKSRYSRWGW